MFNELNQYRNTVREGVDTTEMEFKPLMDFCGETIICDGFFFTEGKFGKQVVAVGSGYLINMPQRAVEQFEKIEENEAMLKAVLSRHLAITDLHMINTKNGTTVAYTLADC